MSAETASDTTNITRPRAGDVRHSELPHRVVEESPAVASPELAEGIHPVVDLIRQRVAEGSRPGERNDPHTLALAIEGGGMRGVLAAGMTLAMETLGLRLAFDVVYGSSAGSMMGAYFISGQSALAPSIYIQDLPNTTFISLRRLLTRRPVMNLDYLVDEVIGSIKPLDYETVLASPIKLHVLATSIVDGRSADLTGFERPEELREAMRAAARLPGIGGPPVKIQDMQCLDSGLTDSLAFRSAIRGGASHVLALHTRAEGGSPEPLSARQAWFMRSVLGVPREAIDLVKARPALYVSEMEELKRLCSVQSNDGPLVLAVGPRAEDPTIGRLGRNRSQLEAGARVGIDAVYRTLRCPEPRLYQVFKPYWRPRPTRERPAGD